MKRNLVGKILGKIKIFVQDFVPIRTALSTVYSIFIYCTGSSEVPRNPVARRDVSSIPASGIFLTKKNKKQNKNAQRVEND